jgi:hypothetical protein
MPRTTRQHLKGSTAAGTARAGGVQSVHFAGVPLGLSPEELKRYLREKGAEICGPRTPVATVKATREGE